MPKRKSNKEKQKVNTNLKNFHDTKCPYISYDDPKFFYLLLKHLKEEQDKAKDLNGTNIVRNKVNKQ